MSKCLVTGGAGFIGSHIVEELIKSGEDVVVIDNESSNNGTFYWNSKSKNLKGDITDFQFIKSCFKDIDYVFHCAAESSIDNAIKHPIKTAETNILGTCNILECAKEFKVKKVLYSSTASAYGNNPSPNKENQPDDCLNPYSVSKVAGEKYCKIYYELFNLKTIIFRYFNVYGERSPSKGQYAPVISTFLRQKLNKETLTIFGDGNQTRDFIHVKDVARINLIAAKSNLSKENFGQVYNVGSGRSLSINTIANQISKNQIKLPPKKGEVIFSEANINKTREILNWKAEVKIESWIKDQIKNLS